MADQLFSSLSNVLVVVLVARVMNPEEFGRFALGYTVLTMALALTRAYLGTRLSLTPDRASAKRLTANLVASMALCGPALALVVLGLSAAATGVASLGVLAIVAVSTPIVCAQDLLRFGAVASGRPWVALVSDGFWVAMMVLPFALRVTLSPTAALLLWSGSAVGALGLALVLTRQVPRLAAGLAELRRRDRVGESLTFGAVVATAGSLWVLLVVSQVISSTAAGSLRGASTAMGPVNVLMALGGLSLTPALVRRRRNQDLRFCIVTAAVLGGLTLLWGTLLLLLPERAGMAAFGASWSGIRSVLPWTLVEYVLLSVAAAAVLGLKVRFRSGPLIRERATLAGATALGGTAAALITGEVWAVAAALAVAATAAATVGWLYLLRGPVPVGPLNDERVPLPAGQV